MKWLQKARKGKGVLLPVMFFGTFEVGWIPAASVHTWQAGLDKKFTARKLKLLSSSVQQVTLRQEKRVKETVSGTVFRWSFSVKRASAFMGARFALDNAHHFTRTGNPLWRAVAIYDT